MSHITSTTHHSTAKTATTGTAATSGGYGTGETIRSPRVITAAARYLAQAKTHKYPAPVSKPGETKTSVPTSATAAAQAASPGASSSSGCVANVQSGGYPQVPPTLSDRVFSFSSSVVSGLGQKNDRVSIGSVSIASGSGSESSAVAIGMPGMVMAETEANIEEKTICGGLQTSAGVELVGKSPTHNMPKRKLRRIKSSQNPAEGLQQSKVSAPAVSTEPQLPKESFQTCQDRLLTTGSPHVHPEENPDQLTTTSAPGTDSTNLASTATAPQHYGSFGSDEVSGPPGEFADAHASAQDGTGLSSTALTLAAENGPDPNDVQESPGPDNVILLCGQPSPLLMQVRVNDDDDDVTIDESTATSVAASLLLEEEEDDVERVVGGEGLAPKIWLGGKYGVYSRGEDSYMYWSGAQTAPLCVREVWDFDFPYSNSNNNSSSHDNATTTRTEDTNTSISADHITTTTSSTLTTSCNASTAATDHHDVSTGNFSESSPLSNWAPANSVYGGYTSAAAMGYTTPYYYPPQCAVDSQGTVGPQFGSPYGSDGASFANNNLAASTPPPPSPHCGGAAHMIMSGGVPSSAGYGLGATGGTAPTAIASTTGVPYYYATAEMMSSQGYGAVSPGSSAAAMTSTPTRTQARPASTGGGVYAYTQGGYYTPYYPPQGLPLLGTGGNPNNNNNNNKNSNSNNGDSSAYSTLGGGGGGSSGDGGGGNQQRHHNHRHSYAGRRSASLDYGWPQGPQGAYAVAAMGGGPAGVVYVGGARAPRTLETVCVCVLASFRFLCVYVGFVCLCCFSVYFAVFVLVYFHMIVCVCACDKRPCAYMTYVRM